jgi:hypothetical protein
MAKRERKGAFVKPKKKQAPKKANGKKQAPAQKPPAQETKAKSYPEITLRALKMNVTKAINKPTPSERRAAMVDILMRTVQGNLSPEFAAEAERLKEIK